MKEFKNFVLQEIKECLLLAIESIDNMSESTREKEVEFFKSEALRMLEETRKQIESFARFQQNNYCK